jgi:hypothetical protein
MRAPAKLGAYAAGLALVLAAGAGIGAAVGPLAAADEADTPSHAMDGADSVAEAAGDDNADSADNGVHADDNADADSADNGVHADENAGSAVAGNAQAHDTAGDATASTATTSAADAGGPASTPAAAAPGEQPAGLSSSDAGYTLAPDRTIFDAASPGVFSFRILGPDGHAVTAFDTRHERDLHLVIVSTDLGDYQHLHPTLAADGTWSTELTLPRAGGYRAYADFAAAGADPVTLATELSASGAFAPRPLPPPAATDVVDGYEVRLEGAATVGADGEVRFRVHRDGQAVTDLEPYLGAYGHLVAIRSTDRAYLHVHPTEASSPSEVVFSVHAPSPGAYGLFLDFQHGGVVRTAAFTLDVAAGGAAPGTDHPTEEADHGH